MDLQALNAPRWMQAGPHGFYEAWYVVASDPRSGLGLWLRYAVDRDEKGADTFSIWGSWFEGDRSFALRNVMPAAAIGRTGVRFGAAELADEICTGEVEGGGHSLRWRLRFGQGAPPDADFVPRWLQPVARLKGSGFLLPHPAGTVSGAVEVDGRIVDLVRVPAGQAHLWGKQRYPSWAWARCNAFAEDPDASIDLIDVEGPAGVRVPLFTLRYRGQVHRFGEALQIARCRSVIASPAWHFSASDNTLAIDGVARAPLEQMVQVQYADPDGSLHHCQNSELAHMEIRVRTRALPGAPWRPETTLTSKSAACLEFCGRVTDPRVERMLVTEAASPTSFVEQKEARTSRSVAS